MRVLALLTALSALPVAIAIGQQPPASANAVGTVYDSIRIRPLAGARVVVDASTLSATTDADGRFHLEGIPVGRRVLRVEHPMLDTLGISLQTEPEVFAAGTTSAHEFGTPSPETLLQIVCAPAWRSRGPAALMGRVREADSGKPAVGAKVSLVWYELNIASAVRRVPRVREATIGPDGTYRLCGLPAELDGKVQVMHGALTSGEIGINFGQDLLVLRSMSIAAPGALVSVSTAPDSTGARPRPTVFGTARLSGRVLNRSGSPLSGARVQLEGTTRSTATRANGEFALDSLPPGTQSVAVRLLGYAPVETAVDLSSRDPSSVTIMLEDFVPTLETVRVTAQRERALDDVGFTRRKRSGLGHYIDAEALKSRNAQYFSDVLRSAPGIRVSQQNGRQFLQSSRDPTGGCVVIYVDGNMWQQMEPGDIDDFVKPHEVGAIEVYGPTATPAEYHGGGGACTTIVAWTHRRLERKKR